MAIDPNLMKELIESFSSEFDEHTQAITKGLLTLEKNTLSAEEKHKMTEIIFRSAHNIKGTARSLGMNNVSEIAHRIESLFSDIQKTTKQITPEIIDLCFVAVDKMHSALHAFIENKSLSFDFNSLMKDLECGKLGTPTKSNHGTQANQNNISSDLESLRVPIIKIDKLSNLLDEIQVSKIAFENYSHELKQLTEKFNEFSSIWNQLSCLLPANQQLQMANDQIMDIAKTSEYIHKNMKNRINELKMISHSLQDEVRELRMIPVRNILHTFPRYIRDLSRELNKNCELKIKGDDVKVDKAVLDKLKDPLVHILRNAMDHGIENASLRKSKGKKAEGLIDINIKEENGKIQISVADDGAGIDVNKVKMIAKNKNLISDLELNKLSDAEILEFIFQPDFSLKETITDVSGRGIGLDVVKSNVEDLKGEVSVTTDPENGTTFVLKIPLTISSTRGLLVRCGEQIYVVPTSFVESVMHANINEIHSIQGGQALNLNANTIPIRSLSDTLNIPKHSELPENKIPLIIVKRGRALIAFIIDEVVEEKEIVIKSFMPPLDKMTFAAGATLLENNQVVIVLEVSDLIKAALQNNKLSPLVSDHAVQKEPEKPHILVVDDSITTRTLEKNILESKNYQVTVAVNGQEAWNILQKQKFSLVITDVVMPIMDGFTLTDHVKKSKKLRKLPVIIVTSLGSDSEKKRGIEVGADAYIVKSEFESGVLLDVVSQLI